MSFLIVIGEQFPFPVPSESGATVGITDATLELVVQINKMTGSEKKAVRNGLNIRAWETEEACGLFVSIGGGKMTFDAPINAALQPTEARAFVDRGENAVRWFALDRGIVQKFGFFGLEQADLKLLKECFNKQLEKGLGKDEWKKVLSRVYRKYPRPALLPMKKIEPSTTDA
jgi:hypothetical protein